MCGIFGLWNIGGGPVDREALKAGTDSLRHRGPDDAGFLLIDSRSGKVAPCGEAETTPSLQLSRLDEIPHAGYDLGFGFRRLAIFDPSPAGHQPMSTPDGSHWIIFNGAIYNYLELRQDLVARGHRFRTATDTEVILAAYKEWGSGCLQRFNGMWAFAIWDARRRELFLARDRFGVKPLYRGGRSEVFVFASEIKALIASRAVPFGPDPSAIAAYVALGHTPRPGRGTFFEGVSEFPAGHHLTVDRDHKERLTSFWRIDPHGSSVPSETAVRAHRELFDDAVRLRLRADVKIGSCLSGGLDSSSIVATVGRLMRDDRDELQDSIGALQQTFSAVYDIDGPWDETPYIDPVVEATGVYSNTTVPQAERLWKDIENLSWHQDEPFLSTSVFAQWCVMSAVGESGVRVLLDGQGADEVLGGYSSLYRPFLSGLLRAGQVRQAISESFAMRRMGVSTSQTLARVGWSQLFQSIPVKVLVTKLRSIATSAPLSPHLTVEVDRDAIEAEFHATRSLSGFLEHLMYEGTLPDFLRYEDRNSMAFSIEARVPFLDYRLVDYAFGPGGRYRIRDGWLKWIHRKAMEDRLPHGVAWRKDKVGFATPQRHWLGSDRSQLIDRLRSSSLVREYLDVDRASSDLSHALDGPDVNAPWRWVNLAVWLETMKARTGA